MNRMNRAAEATMLATILFLVIATDTATGQNETGNGQAVTGEVLFTGKLMGYFRLPNQQSFDTASPDKPCPAPPDSKRNSMDRAKQERMYPSDDAQAFISQYRDYRDYSGSILVGTGDNFSPNYYSRVLVDAPTEARPEKGSEPVSLAPNKELWNWDSIAPRWTWYNSNVSK